MSALGQKQTYAVQNRMSALPPIATAKADMPKWSCPLYPRKRHQTRHMGMSARAKSRLMPCSKKDRYSITLSARASTLDGNARPSALAATEERSIRSACHSARIRKCAARHLAPGGARDELNAPPLCSTGKESA